MGLARISAVLTTLENRILQKTQFGQIWKAGKSKLLEMVLEILSV